MQADLTQEACDACRADAPKVNAVEARELQQQIPDWQLIDVDGTQQLQREYSFKNFAQALAFTNRIGEMAEKLQHHPDILTAWGRVRIVWYTHKIGGLHRNDFRCAARSDELFQQMFT